MSLNESVSNILLSTYHTKNTSGENFISDHTFSYQLAGSLVINDGNAVTIFKEGDFRLSIRNKLAKYVKMPPPNGEYQSLSFSFSQQFLRSVQLENQYTPNPQHTEPAVLLLHRDLRYENIANSILPFLPFSPEKDKDIIDLKLKEAIYTLLKVQPDLKNILFDFSDPYKIDIEAYMEKNFQFNLSMTRFAYMTGRSLSSFKRDFQYVFGTSPGRWLLYRRLKEAFYLIKEKKKPVSEVYLEVGFEDISHFSRSFKDKFGVSPSRIVMD